MTVLGNLSLDDLMFEGGGVGVGRGGVGGIIFLRNVFFLTGQSFFLF